MADIESAEKYNDTCVRGFHVYKDVWRPVIGEELRCQREEDNPRDPYAVTVTKSCTGVVGVEVVGHVPRYPPQGSGNFWPRGTSFLRKYSRSAITQN